MAEGWGDTHFARDIQRALEAAGHPTRLHLRPHWDAWWATRDDVGLHLLGRAIAQRRPGRLEVLWHISHPDAASEAAYDAHDLVFVASDSFARWMDGRVDVPVRSLHQATDPRRFDPSMTGPHHELLFVANSRGVRRHILADLLPTSRDLAVYGRAWTPARLDPRHLAGEHIVNADLGGYYAAADIVLNDHWDDMQREGFLSNRLYDASAAGAFVVSDGIEGLEAEFDGGVVAYEDADDLRTIIERFLADPEARREHAARARAAVLARHTFERRIEEMLAVVEPMLSERAADSRPGCRSSWSDDRPTPRVRALHRGRPDAEPTTSMSSSSTRHGHPVRQTRPARSRCGGSRARSSSGSTSTATRSTGSRHGSRRPASPTA